MEGQKYSTMTYVPSSNFLVVKKIRPSILLVFLCDNNDRLFLRRSEKFERDSRQGSQGKLTGHTIIHLLGCFLGHFHRTVTSKVLKYLYHPGDSSKGIEATLCGIRKDTKGSCKNAF
jgi:hypothetical protein